MFRFDLQMVDGFVGFFREEILKIENQRFNFFNLEKMAKPSMELIVVRDHFFDVFLQKNRENIWVH